MPAILLLVSYNMQGQGHKMVVQSHTFGREGWTGVDLKLGPSAYQLSTVQLAQTSTMLVMATVFLILCLSSEAATLAENSHHLYNSSDTAESRFFNLWWIV